MNKALDGNQPKTGFVDTRPRAADDVRAESRKHRQQLPIQQRELERPPAIASLSVLHGERAHWTDVRRSRLADNDQANPPRWLHLGIDVVRMRLIYTNLDRRLGCIGELAPKLLNRHHRRLRPGFLRRPVRLQATAPAEPPC